MRREVGLRRERAAAVGLHQAEAEVAADGREVGDPDRRSGQVLAREQVYDVALHALLLRQPVGADLVQERAGVDQDRDGTFESKCTQDGCLPL